MGWRGVRTCALLLGALWWSGCADDSADGREGGQSGTGGTGDAIDAGGVKPPPIMHVDPVPVDDSGVLPGELEITSVELEPKDRTLVAVDGAMPEQLFTTTVTYEDGSTGPALGPRYEIVPLAMGSIDEASGQFVANGLAGGQALVRVTVPDKTGEVTAETTLTVRLERQVLGVGAPADAADKFTPTPVVDAGRQVSILYPLDGAVMPQNVFPADIQWDVGAAGDLYRVKLVKSHVSLTAYVLHDGAAFQYHYLPDGPLWRSLTQTDPLEAARLRVDRWDSATQEVINGKVIEVSFAQAALTGTVYYWDINATRIQRVDDGTNNRVSFMPDPPASKDDGQNCVGCHSVSRSGRYMVGRLGPGFNIAGVFDLTADLTPNPPPTVYPLNQASPYSAQWWFSSWSPDDSRVVASTESSNQRLAFFDPFTGLEVPVTGTMPVNVTHPDWAPDGTRIAYVANPNDWGGQNTAGNIAVLPVTGTDTVGAVSVLHQGNALPGAVEGGSADSYPSWSPDSLRLAFAHGSTSRSETGSSSLYMMQGDGSGVARLNTAVGASSVNNFQPRFSPFQQGGYYWLSFLSKRTYGNAQVGSLGASPSCKGSTGPGVPQIWVTAVRVDAAGGQDGSSVPYWLPGQDPTSCNISAFWAPRPCRPDGDSCTTNAECCGGDCRPNAGGDLVCAPPPPDRCRQENETCTTSADCCPPSDAADPTLECVNRVCVVPPPTCIPRYGACKVDADCCSPWQCLDNVCNQAPE